jgi:hypothetical protein
MAIRRIRYEIEPMTLGNMRELGVSWAKWPDHWSHGLTCGRPNWKEQPQRGGAWPGVPMAMQRETIVILAVAAGAAALGAAFAMVWMLWPS